MSEYQKPYSDKARENYDKIFRKNNMVGIKELAEDASKEIIEYRIRAIKDEPMPLLSCLSGKNKKADE